MIKKLVSKWSKQTHNQKPEIERKKTEKNIAETKQRMEKQQKHLRVNVCCKALQETRDINSDQNWFYLGLWPKMCTLPLPLQFDGGGAGAGAVAVAAGKCLCVCKMQVLNK